MYILVLHGMGKKSFWLDNVADVELLFPRYDKKNFYFTHNAVLKFPNFLRKINFSAILFMSTFMDKICESNLDGEWIKQYEFLKKTIARKIVFPQDDYWFSEIRDKFYIDWNIDEVHPIVSPENWKELLPNYTKTKKFIKQGYTTYITPHTQNFRKRIIPYEQRNFDIVYRANEIPNAPNHLGYIKAIIGDRFIKKLPKEHKLKLDIKAGQKYFIYKDKWINFISNSKAILGSNSGSSVNLRNRKIFLKFLQKSDKKSKNYDNFKDIIALKDRNKLYTCISPKNIEAAFLDVIQILVRGQYGNLLTEYEDYIPLDEDCKNIDEVLTLLSNEKYVKKVINSCRRKLISKKELHSEYLIKSTLKRIMKNNSFTNNSNHYLNFILNKFIFNLITFFNYQLYSLKEEFRLLINFLMPKKVKLKIKSFIN